MFFEDSSLVLEIFGVFKMKRDMYEVESTCGRSYDALSVRLLGKCQFNNGGREFEVTKNDLIYIPNKATYKQRTEGEEIIAVHFINYNSKDKTNMEIFSSENGEFYQAEFERMHKIWTEKKSEYRRQCTSILYNILYKTAQSLDEKSYENEEIHRIMNNAINYIHQHYKREKISISELSKNLFVSDTYFRRLFKKNYRVSPNEYIILLKLEYASQMLAIGHYSVSEVPESAGFSNSKYFSRIFKKHSEYKNNLTKKALCRECEIRAIFLYG